jgi:two-component system chemotaxis response regulator CheY
MKRVLIVDDSMFMRQAIKSTLTASGKYEIIGEAGTGDQGVEMALELRPDLITLDNVLPDMLGIDIVRELRKEQVNCKIIMVSAVGQDNVIAESKSAGADDYLVKPFTNEVLLERVDRLAGEITVKA